MRSEFPRELVCRAFREAGRIAVAAEFGIEVHVAALTTINNQPPGTRLMSLEDVLERSKAGDKKTELIEQFIKVRLAGPVTEMVRAAHKWESKQHVVNWHHWRKRWKMMLTRASDADLDTAFEIALGWLDRTAESDLDTRLDELWSEAENLIRRLDTWTKIQTIAGRLLRVDVMTGAEALRLIDSI